MGNENLFECSRSHDHAHIWWKTSKNFFFRTKRPMTLKHGMQQRVLEYYQCFHMMTLGWPWPFLWQGQICFWMLLHGWKLWVVIYFQVCSHSAYPQHSGERYRTNGPLVTKIWNQHTIYFSCIPDKIFCIFHQCWQSYLTYPYPTRGTDKIRITTCVGIIYDVTFQYSGCQCKWTWLDYGVSYIKIKRWRLKSMQEKESIMGGYRKIRPSGSLFGISQTVTNSDPWADFSICTSHSRKILIIFMAHLWQNWILR